MMVKVGEIVPVVKWINAPGKFRCELRQRIALGLLFLLSGGASGTELTDGSLDISVSGYGEFAELQRDVVFELRRENPAVNGVRRQVMAFETDGLRQYALVLTPLDQPPESGWPVLLFNHGYHPEPANYGRIADGSSSRPGDYYRGIAQTFAERGYVVVVPDYRGHNDSEGARFTDYALADSWYTRDAIAAYFALQSLAGINLQQVYMLGHSMGGPITQRALLVLGERIRAASVWSSSGPDSLAGQLVTQLEQTGGADESAIDKPALNRLRDELQQLRSGTQYSSRYVLNDLQTLEVPLAIHHARHDASTSAMDSIDLAGQLYLQGKPYQLFIYDSTEHLFSADDYRQAVERDISWFERYR
ncbi:MAG: alpha/beta fold hydrolase [Halioglobus sp.]